MMIAERLRDLSQSLGAFCLCLPLPKENESLTAYAATCPWVFIAALAQNLHFTAPIFSSNFPATQEQ
jgi:hypothetical protein